MDHNLSYSKDFTERHIKYADVEFVLCDKVRLHMDDSKAFVECDGVLESALLPRHSAFVTGYLCVEYALNDEGKPLYKFWVAYVYSTEWKVSMGGSFVPPEAMKTLYIGGSYVTVDGETFVQEMANRNAGFDYIFRSASHTCAEYGEDSQGVLDALKKLTSYYKLIYLDGCVGTGKSTCLNGLVSKDIVCIHEPDNDWVTLWLSKYGMDVSGLVYQNSVDHIDSVIKMYDDKVTGTWVPTVRCVVVERMHATHKLMFNESIDVHTCLNDMFRLRSIQMRGQRFKSGTNYGAALVVLNYGREYIMRNVQKRGRPYELPVLTPGLLESMQNTMLLTILLAAIDGLDVIVIEKGKATVKLGTSVNGATEWRKRPGYMNCQGFPVVDRDVTCVGSVAAGSVNAEAAAAFRSEQEALISKTALREIVNSEIGPEGSVIDKKFREFTTDAVSCMLV